MMESSKSLLYKKVGMRATLLMDDHLLALELVQLQFDLLRNGRGQSMGCNVGVARSIILV